MASEMGNGIQRKKFHVKVKSEKRPRWQHHLRSNILQKSEKDLGVIINSCMLTPDDRINENK